MSDWWEKPYAGGGPAKPKGFPRALYPPDAVNDGKQPSTDGPDVVAYKRTICKLGRWGDWDPSSWDDSFSNAFSHGKGTGNVKDSGVAGFQRQQNIEPTGWVGEATYNSLRYCLVPTGPNKGTQAMDSVAVDLLNQAYELFQVPPPTTDQKTLVRKYLTEFCNKGLANGQKWEYTQNRAVKVDVDPTGYVSSDCSGSCIQAFHYAKRKSGVNVPDPAKYSYAGWGNTWDDEDGHPKVTNGKYEVGDLGHFDGHVILCMKAGNADTADWWSFGSEPPSKRKLYYRTDFRFVVRPPLL